MSGNGSTTAKAWLRALELTAPMAQHRERTFPAVIEELADQWGDASALLSKRECMTYRGLNERANQYARWALSMGWAKGDTIGLFMRNRPEYVAIWLGLTRVGCVVALLNTNLSGPSLAHCMNIVSPRHVIVDADLQDSMSAAMPYAVGAPASSLADESSDLRFHSGEPLRASERRAVFLEDRALYIYTSGTTGLPKAANVSHARIMQWSHWFAGMMGTAPSDRMYDCLPLYHSVGGVVAVGAALVGGGSVVIAEKFSATHFWSDVIRWDCTLVQYIGELCRYLLQTPGSPQDTGHGIRMACGNGLSREIWEDFQSRFQIPRIFEFYAATEGGVSLFNVEGECGSVGRVPPYLRHRFSAVLVRFNVDQDEPLRNEQGFCERCAPDEVGEAIGRLDRADAGSRFEGYTSAEASEKRLLRNVFETGDEWVRTGDLLRKDVRGFFYFVDRVGDTFRWKGENVATGEVAATIFGFPGIKHAIVYGVTIPGCDGRAGMAAIVCEDEIDMQQFRDFLTSRLPSYARPLFLRIGSEVELTGTFKPAKADLARQGYDPAVTSDALYFNHAGREAFVRLDGTLHRQIQNGEIRV